MDTDDQLTEPVYTRLPYTFSSVSTRPRGISFAFLSHWKIAFVAAALMVVCGHLLIKAGLRAIAPSVAGASIGERLAHIGSQQFVLLGLGIYGLGTLCWMAALAQTELSLLYPRTSMNYNLIAFFSALLFHESVSPRRATGIAVVALGMVLLTRSQRTKAI